MHWHGKNSAWNSVKQLNLRALSMMNEFGFKTDECRKKLDTPGTNRSSSTSYIDRWILRERGIYPSGRASQLIGVC